MAEALSGLVEKSAADRAEAAKPPPKKRSYAPVLAVLLAIGCAALWMMELPGLSFGAADAPPLEERDAGLRIALTIQVRSIEAFRDAEKRLPERLEETGTPVFGVTYQKLDSARYELRVPREADTLVYHSEQPIADFLGGAASRFAAPHRP